MDNLVTIHEEFISKIIKLCLLDSKSKNFLDLITNLLQISLDFRTLVKKHLLSSNSHSTEDDNDDLEIDNKNDASLLNYESVSFMDRYNECKTQLDMLKSKHRLRMQHLNQGLKKYTKKGIFNYLNEAFIRFNFNHYYISREEEGE